MASTLNHSITMKHFICLAVVFAIVSSSGCASLNTDWKKMLSWSPASRLKSSKYETPTHMIAIWSPDILTQPEKPPTRGFGGRIYFYNDKNQAVPVEGQLVVYGYDETYNPDQPGQPQRKFAFTPEQFTKHFSESELGASYSIWLPWDAVGGEQQSVSLVPVFTATSGKVVMGEQVANVLPGPHSNSRNADRPTSLLAARPQSDVRQVTHEQPQTEYPQSISATGQEPTSRLKMRTSTIQLTPNLQRHIAQSPAMAPQNHPSPVGVPNSPISYSQPATPNTTAIPMTSHALPEGPPVETVQDRLKARFGHPRSPVRVGPDGRSSLPVPWTPPYPATPPSALRPASIPHSSTSIQAG